MDTIDLRVDKVMSRSTFDNQTPHFIGPILISTPCVSLPRHYRDLATRFP